MDDELRRPLKDALDVEQPDPGLRHRVAASMPADGLEPRPRWQWLMGAVAVLVAVALVGSLMYFRLGQSHQPASEVAVGTVSIASQLDFKCRLPINVYNSVAMLSLPDGAVSTDSSIKPAPNGAKGSYGPWGYTYVAQAARWLPVQEQWVAPDGRSYAYATNTTGVPGQPYSTGAVHVVEVAGGRDRQLWQGEGNTNIVGVGPGGVYFTRQGYQSSPQPGAPELWGQGYFALGDRAQVERGAGYLRDYYEFTGGFAERIAAANLVTAQAVKDFVRGLSLIHL